MARIVPPAALHASTAERSFKRKKKPAEPKQGGPGSTPRIQRHPVVVSEVLRDLERLAVVKRSFAGLFILSKPFWLLAKAQCAQTVVKTAAN